VIGARPWTAWSEGCISSSPVCGIMRRRQVGRSGLYAQRAQVIFSRSRRHCGHRVLGVKAEEPGNIVCLLWAGPCILDLRNGMHPCNGSRYPRNTEKYIASRDMTFEKEIVGVYKFIRTAIFLKKCAPLSHVFQKAPKKCAPLSQIFEIAPTAGILGFHNPSP
jgi:hypothetical protein